MIKKYIVILFLAFLFHVAFSGILWAKIDEISWGEISIGISYGRRWNESTQEYLDDFELQIPTPKAKNQPLPPEEPVPPELTYLSAIGHNIDEGDRPDYANPWEDEPRAYDDNTDTFAKSKVSHNTWTAWLELLPPTEKSLGIRFWIDPASQGSFFRVEILYSDYESWDCLRDWNFPYSSLAAHRGEWVTLDYPEKLVEKARVKFHSAGISDFYQVYLNEFQFKTYE